MLKERVLCLLERNRGKIVTGGELARLLGVSRTAVWKSVRILRENGNEIESIPNSGYRLTGSSDGLSEAAVRDFLRTRKFGCIIELLLTVPSTNTYLKRLDTAALPEGYAVISDVQTEGRGRLNRTFYSPAGEGIYLSVLLKPGIPLAETPFLTICAAVAVTRAIENICGIRTDIKWVNDIYHNGKKLCGILTEASVSAELRSVDFVVVGIGVNTGRVAPEVNGVATSIYEASGVRGIRTRLTAEILNQFESVYIDYTLRGGRREILDAYSGRMSIIGRRAEADVQGASRVITIMGVDDSGGLIARCADGGICHIETGEIKLINGY